MLLRAKIPTAACGGNREGFLAQRSARREARSRAEADAGHRKRALLPLPEQRAYELAVLAQRSARRKARSRAEADAGHRKRALLPLPEQRACELAVLAQRSARREARTKGRSGCRAPQKDI